MTAPHVAAEAYLGSLPLEQRRQAGQVYTPQHLVDFILDLADYAPSAELEKMRVLDPACGAGAFLDRTISRLAARLENQGCTLSSPTGRDRFVEIVRKRVFGVDNDAYACELARDTMRFRVEELIETQLPREFFQANILEQDFLFGEDDPTSGEGYDFIVGNPPYVPTTRLSEVEKDRLRERFLVANGRIDLYTLFFERGLGLLRGEGRLAFITPNKFLTGESTSRLREHLLSVASLRVIANFKSHKVFTKAATVPCVTVLQRRKATKKFTLLECGIDSSGPTPGVTQARIEVHHPEPGPQPWFLAAPELLTLARKIEGKHRKLGSFATRISVGIATGRDRIYVLPSDRAKDLEPELLRPAVGGKDVLQYGLRPSGLQILIPYLPRTDDKRPSLVDLREFPKVRAYLESHRDELEKRHCVRTWKKSWYDIHDPWTLDITGLTKILVPDIACSNRFMLDPGTYCPLHSAYYILPGEVEPRFLTAILNSGPVEFLVRLQAPVVKDGFSRYRRQFLITLPVPETTAAKRRAITTAVDAGNFSRADELCCRLFGLETSDLRILRDFLGRMQTVHGADALLH